MTMPPELSVTFQRTALSRQVPLANLSLHCLDWPGSGVPVLLLHPNRTNARVWDFVVEHATLPNRFIAPDARGHGLSDYPAQGYAYKDYLDDLRALLDALEVPRVHLVGAATGGNLALLLASEPRDQRPCARPDAARVSLCHAGRSPRPHALFRPLERRHEGALQPAFVSPLA